MADTSSVEVQMQKLLEQVDKDIQKAMDESMKQVAKESVSKLKNSSPRKTGKYARGWTTKQIDKNGIVVHNSKHYQLTHLLENGHVIRNKYGTYGRTSGIKHIQPVEQWASDELPLRIMEKIE